MERSGSSALHPNPSCDGNGTSRPFTSRQREFRTSYLLDLFNASCQVEYGAELWRAGHARRTVSRRRTFGAADLPPCHDQLRSPPTRSLVLAEPKDSPK